MGCGLRSHVSLLGSLSTAGRPSAGWLIFAVLAQGGCGSTAAIYPGPAPKSTAAVLEGYSRFWGGFSERAEIASVDRLAEGGIARSTIGNVTRAQVEPGERCVELEFKTCTVGCGEPTYCAFTDYFVAGQEVQLKPGSLKLDKPVSATDTAVNGTMQVEVTAQGFTPNARRIKVLCGSAIKGVCERGTPDLPRQALPVKGR